jgi:hypothetical protein
MMSLSHDQAMELAGGFVLGALEPGEMDAVREHVGSCRESHAELTELGGAAQALALDVDPIEPAPSLRQRIVGAISGTPARTAGVAVGAPRRTWWRTLTPLAWAGALAIVVLAGSTIYLAGQLGGSRSYADALARAVALAAQPGSRTVVLAAQAGQPVGAAGGIAVLPATGSGLLVAQGLAATNGSQVYEAWIIQGSAAPVPAGSFTVGGDGRGVLGAVVPAAPGAVTVALTREPGPGATKPTLPILVSGASGTS